MDCMRFTRNLREEAPYLIQNIRFIRHFVRSIRDQSIPIPTLPLGKAMGITCQIAYSGIKNAIVTPSPPSLSVPLSQRSI